MLGRKTQALEKGIRSASYILSLIAVGMLFVLMLQGFADVAGRYLFDKPIMGTLQRGEVLLALIIFLGWGYTQIAKAHVNVEIFLSRLPPRGRAAVNFATTFLALVLFSLIVWQGVAIAQLYHEQGKLVYLIEWPMAPLHLFVSLGALVLCLVLIMEMVRFFLQMRGED